MEDRFVVDHELMWSRDGLALTPHAHRVKSGSDMIEEVFENCTSPEAPVNPASNISIYWSVTLANNFILPKTV